MERPLVPVLAAMELTGIKVDRDTLRRMSNDFATRIGELETEIHRLAGRSFTIGSPKQLGEILFDEMSLDGGRKGKSGSYATGADVLEALAAQGHDLPARVRSEERRVGKEGVRAGRSRWSPYYYKNKICSITRQFIA